MTKYIGAHVSASGGVGNAILNAEAIGKGKYTWIVMYFNLIEP